MLTSSCVGLCSRLSDFCWLFSLLYLHLLTATFCWLCHSLDNYLKPTVLFCPPLLTALSVFSQTFLFPSTSGLAGDLVLRPFVWVSRQNRWKDRLSCANTNRNELLRIVSHYIQSNWTFNVFIWVIAQNMNHLSSLVDFFYGISTFLGYLTS